MKDHYVYMVNFIGNPRCFKIGSSKDPISRDNSLSCSHGATEIIIVGSAKNALVSEREIQRHMEKFSNKSITNSGNRAALKIIGSPRSKEYFVFDSFQMLEAMGCFQKYCYNLYIPEPLPDNIRNSLIGVEA